MGNYIPTALNFNRQNTEGVESLEGNNANSYRYPPKSGPYFANHFVMAGERFDNINSETFLFGENNDLNYLSSKPVPFPYNSPSEDNPSNAIRCMVHLRKDSLKLSREKSAEKQNEMLDKYHTYFIFDADVDCAVRIFMMAREESDTENGIVYTSRKPELASKPCHFKKGSGQVFDLTEFTITPDEFQPAELSYIPGSQEVPLLIQITAEDPEYQGHSESTLTGIEKLSDGSYSIKFMKQKIMVDGFCMMLQELYGIENKNTDNSRGEDDIEDDTTECVVCMSNLRDTVMLPCRHLCLCSDCAGQMRNKESRCPICRADFYALLEIKGFRKKLGATREDEYEQLPLIEALNGKVDGSNAELGPMKRSTSARSARSSRKSLKARIGGSNKSIRNPTPSAPPYDKSVEDEVNCSQQVKTEQKSQKEETSPGEDNGPPPFVEAGLRKSVTDSPPPPPDRSPNPEPPHSARLPQGFTPFIEDDDEEQDGEPTIIIDSKKLLRDTSSVDDTQLPAGGGETCSLPGTPMDSEKSYDLGASGNSSVLFNSSKGSLVIATRAQVTTPSHVNLVSNSPGNDEKL